MNHAGNKRDLVARKGRGFTASLPPEIVNVSDEVLTKLYTEITQKQMEE